MKNKKGTRISKLKDAIKELQKEKGSMPLIEQYAHQLCIAKNEAEKERNRLKGLWVYRKESINDYLKAGDVLSIDVDLKAVGGRK